MKDVKNYEGYYQVCEEGHIYSLGNHRIGGKGFIRLKPSKVGKGYFMVGLSHDKDKKNFYLHRLIAEAFLPNPTNLPEVNHKDKDKTNNRITNLEWCTRSQNMEHANERTYILKSPLGETVTFHNLYRFCRENNLSPQCLQRVIYKTRNHHKGWSLI